MQIAHKCIKMAPLTDTGEYNTKKLSRYNIPLYYVLGFEIYWGQKNLSRRVIVGSMDTYRGGRTHIEE